MIFRCPSCQKRISRNTVACQHCGWSLGQLTKESEVEPESFDAGPPPKKTALEMHVETAIDAISRQQFSDALNSLNRAIIDAPKSKLGEIYSLRGYAHLMLDDYRRSEADCSTAIEKRGPDSETLAWRAAARGHQNKWRSALEDLIDARLLATSNVDEYDHLIETYREESSRFFGEMVQQGKSDSELFCHRGWVYFLVGNYEKAVRDFQLAINLDANHAWSLLGSAESDLKLERVESALKTCRKLNKKKHDHDPVFRRALMMTTVRALAANRELESALEYINQLREQDSGHSLAHMRCGQLAMEIGDYVSAIDDFSQIIENQPVFLTARKLRGEAYAAINNFQSAENDFSAVLRMLGDDRDADMLTRRGEMRLQQEKIEAAMDDFDAAEEYENVKYSTFLGRARVFAKQENFDQALEECEKALRLDKTIGAVYGVRGRVYFDTKKHIEAIKEFSLAIANETDPSQKAQYHYQRGASQYEAGKPAEALDDFEQAESLQPNHAGTKIWKAATYAKLGKWPEAIETLQSAIATRPAAATQYRQLGQPVAERAIDFFDQQLKKDKHSAGLFKNRGMAYQFLGNIDSAIENYTHAIDEFGFDADTLIRRGQMLARKGNHRQALYDFTAVIQQDRLNHLARYCRAISMLALKKSKRAWQDVIKAGKIAPSEPRYLVLKGELLQKRNKIHDSIRIFTKAITLDPNDSLALRRRGTAFLAVDQNLKAIGDFTRSLEIDPRQPEVIALRGSAHFKNDDLDQAKDDYELALTHNDKLVKAYCGRAKILARQEETEQALIWLTKAFHRFEVPRAVSELLLTRGKIFFQMGRFVPAIVDFTSVMDLQRNDPHSLTAARYGRALALIQQGELEKAKKDFEKVVSEAPKHRGATIALQWMDSGQGQRPANLMPPPKLIRPHRPPKKRKSLTLETQDPKWDKPPPYGDWIVRKPGKSRKEYGPISKLTLDQWVSEGRVPADLRLLRADWKKWRKATYVYPELLPPKERPTKPEAEEVAPIVKPKPASLSSFPEIQTGTSAPAEPSASESALAETMPVEEANDLSVTATGSDSEIENS